MLTHHAYIYEGSVAQFDALVADAAAQMGRETVGNPDIYARLFDKFGIDEARALSQQAQLKSTAGRGLFVIGVSVISTEAQQSLLKLVEEPPAGVVLVFLLPHGVALPTIRSRAQMYVLDAGKTSTTEAKKFLSLGNKERSAMITVLLKDEDGAKDRARDFVNALEAVLFANIEKSVDIREGLTDITKVRNYLSDRSPSLKMLLEHLAAVLPKF
ncbi:MAG: polymerase subunit delta, polymerase subunit delta protein [Candidatus Adlerbacteria bacterium]|nr:polymerase subunit delta, polymerase subunit delta protein [Candidatus Adlerbacteria bacterium]